MKKYALSILALYLFIACNPSRRLSKEQNIPIQIQINDPVKIGESIIFEIKNNSSDPITIFYPQKLWIEKLYGDRWQKLKILECLCDAPCQASEDKMILEPTVNYTLKWDQKESWCGPRRAGQIRETIFKPADEGRYKMVVHFSTKTVKDDSFSQEFSITTKV